VEFCYFLVRTMATARRSLWLVLGALSGGSSVAAGSIGSHYLPKRVEDEYYLKLWHIAVQYHQIHSLALCLCPFVAAPFSHIAHRKVKREKNKQNFPV